MKKGAFDISNMVCPVCGQTFPIPRKKAKRRESGHHKYLWCPFCKQIVNMTEIKDTEFYSNMIGETFVEI